MSGSGFVSINTNIDSIAAGRFYNENIKNLSKANSKLVSGRVDSDASYAPAAAAVGTSLTSSIMAQTQASYNVIQASSVISLASGTLTSMSQILMTMKARGVQANSDTISSSQRSMLNAEYQALLQQVDNTSKTAWNGIELFSGSIDATPNRFATLDAQTTLNTTDTSNTSFDTTQLELSGFMAGSITNINVETSSANQAIVNVTVGDQTFVGTVAYGTAADELYSNAQTITLTSSTNPENKIQLTTGTDGALDLSTTSKIEEQLSAIFGISQGAPIALRSASTDLSANIKSVAAGAGTEATIFGVSSGYDSQTGKATYTLTSGSTTWEQSVDASDALESDRTVTFNNGLTIIIAEGTNEKTQATGIEMFQVQPGASLEMQFQIGEGVDQAISFKFEAANSKTFGLIGSNLLTDANARESTQAINSALNMIENLIAQLGGTQSQLTFTAQGLSLQIQNEEASRSTFIDADITQSLIDSQSASALVNMSGTILQNSLQRPKDLAQLVKSALQ